jgi:hypothetical protein
MVAGGEEDVSFSERAFIRGTHPRDTTFEAISKSNDKSCGKVDLQKVRTF